MNKEAKATKYAIEPMVKLLRSEAISDGGTEKIAAAIEGTWVRVNETMFILMEEGKVTLVYSDETEVGCSCEKFNDPSMNVMCEHIIALESLPEKPQMDINSPDCRVVREYLFSLGWYVENGYLYPSLDAEIPEDEASLVPDEGDNAEAPKLDPVHQDKPLDIGVDDDPKPIGKDMAMVHYQCPKCGEEVDIEDGKLRDWKLNHMDVCKGKTETKNPANKEKPNSWKPKPTVAKSAPVEKPQKEEEKKVKPNTAVAKRDTAVVEKEMPTEAEFQTAKVARILTNQGSIYKVGGKETPDSAAVSSYAVGKGVSTETVILEQTSEYARATVRAHKGSRYTDGSVLIRRDAILEKVLIDLAEKNPKWIIGWSNGLPEFDLNQQVFIGDKSKILGLHIAGVVADKWMFASRDCETKAGRRAQIKMLGADWREDDEVESEVEEMKTVAKR